MTEKEALYNLIRRIPDFETRDLKDQVPLLAWFFHTHWKKEEFFAGNIYHCLKLLNIKIPSSLPDKFEDFPHIVKTRPSNYKLDWRTRDKFDKQLLSTPTSIQIHQLLKDLPTKISIAAEKSYLEETITCYNYGANRAAIVMCWNLAFSHLCNFILKDTSRLTTFNQQLSIKFPKSTVINTFDDFSRFKESEVLDICYSAKLINKNQHKILKEKLDRRNMAAHPSTVIFTQVDVEHYILDLINNAVLAI